MALTHSVGPYIYRELGSLRQAYLSHLVVRMASGTNVICEKKDADFSMCNVAAATAAVYSASAETPGTVTAGAEMSQHRNGQRRDGGAQTAAPKCPAPCLGQGVVGRLGFSS